MSVPNWVVFLATIGLVFLSIEIGARLMKRLLSGGAGKVEVSGVMTGAVLGLLSFMLAFTFNGAAGRHDIRKALVVEEANAIEKTWLRAGFLGEPNAGEMRGLLREYVDLRVKADDDGVDLAAALLQSEALHEKMWDVAQQAGQRSPASITTGLFVTALNETIDVNLKRVSFGIRYRAPPMIWVTLYLLLVIAMVMAGAQSAQSGKRNFSVEGALAISYALVLFLIADLDRPQDGFINVSQQAMIDLQTRLHR